MDQRVAAARYFNAHPPKTTASSAGKTARVVRTAAGAARYGVAVGQAYTAGAMPSKGDRGPMVKRAKQQLAAVGVLPKNAVMDDRFGIHLEQGLRAFQKREGLPVTGKYDPETARKLDSIAPAGDKSTAQPAPKPAASTSTSTSSSSSSSSTAAPAPAAAPAVTEGLGGLPPKKPAAGATPLSPAAQALMAQLMSMSPKDRRALMMKVRRRLARQKRAEAQAAAHHQGAAPKPKPAATPPTKPATTSAGTAGKPAPATPAPVRATGGRTITAP